MIDRGIWATWYDLEDGDRAAFLDWLHGSYLPALEATKKYLWVAHYENQPGRKREAGDFSKATLEKGLDTGTQYVLLIGATTPHVFMNPLTLDQPGDHVKDEAKMLARRRNTWSAVYVEEERSVGQSPPPDGKYSLLPAPAIRMGSYRMKSIEGDFDAGRWYSQYRLPDMASFEGCVRTRKLMCIAGWPKHGILYEFTSPDARGRIWDHFRDGEATGAARFWNIGPDTVHSPASPSLGLRTYPRVP